MYPECNIKLRDLSILFRQMLLIVNFYRFREKGKVGNIKKSGRNATLDGFSTINVAFIRMFIMIYLFVLDDSFTS